jgi:hypothetical protein
MRFASEVLCLRELSAELPRPRLGVGAGTGGFAEVLGMDVGADPARSVLRYAKRRGVSESADDGLVFLEIWQDLHREPGCP